jgi:peroxiredoxin
MKRSIFRVVLAAACGLAGAPGAGGADKAPVVVAEGQLRWRPAPDALPPGAEVAVLAGDLTQDGLISIRYRFPANYAVPPHSRPNDEYMTVLSGTLLVGRGDKLDHAALKAVGEGGGVKLLGGSNYYLQARSEVTVLSTLRGPFAVTYVNAADDPRKKEPRKAAGDGRIDTTGAGGFDRLPAEAPPWTLEEPSGRKCSLNDYRGRPVILIFFLGHDCPHCLAQLGGFARRVKDLESEDLVLVAISPGPAAELREALRAPALKGRLPATVLCDPECRTFRQYHCFDKQAAHGTFFIDGKGSVLWQDTGEDPFTDVEHLLKEGKRLLRRRTAR